MVLQCDNRELLASDCRTAVSECHLCRTVAQVGGQEVNIIYLMLCNII